MSSTLELETIPSITEEFAVEPPTDLEEEIGFEEPELAALEEIEAELESELESETEIEDLEKQISRELGIWKSKTEEVSQDERDDSFWLFEEQAISQWGEVDNTETLENLDVLKLYFRDVLLYPYRVNKTVERKLIKIYTNIRWGDCKVEPSDLEIPEEVANYIFKTGEADSTPEEIERKIEEIVLTSNAKLISKMAYSKSRGGIPMEDLIGDAATGFLRGLRKYDITKINSKSGKPYELSTYVTWWIRQSTDLGVNAQRREMRFKAPLRRRIQEYYKTFYYLQGKLGDEPSNEELAKELDVPVSYIVDIKNSIDSSAVLSLDSDFEHDAGGDSADSNSLYDMLACDTDIEEAFTRSSLHDTMQEILNQCLQLRERNILLMRFRIPPYDNPGKTVEQVEDILMKHFSSKSVGKPVIGENGRLVQTQVPLRYAVQNKITKRWAAEYQWSDWIIGINLLESSGDSAIGIPEIMELVRQFSYDANGKLRAHLRVVENERADANGNKLMEISIHFDNGKGATLKEIGRELDISRERVRQIQDSAISKLIDFAYKKGIDYTGCGRILSGNEEKDAIGMDENHEKWKNPPKRDNFKQAYATPKSYWEIERDAETNPKKKRWSKTVILESASSHVANYDCGISESFDPAELTVGMYVQNLRKELVSVRGKDGKPECKFTGNLVPYRIGTIVEVRDIAVVIKLEGSEELATVMKQYIKPIVPKKKSKR